MALPVDVRERAAHRLSEAERELRAAQGALAERPDDDELRRRYAAAQREMESATAWAAALTRGSAA